MRVSGRFSQLIDLREGERGIVASIAATLFLLIGAHTILETARDALFLDKLPASRLAFVYAALAGLALVVARANTRFAMRFGKRNALIFSLMAASYGTVVFYLMPKSQTAVFAFYLWTALLGTVLIVQFWMFAGTVFTVAQGKRLFGPITAGGVLGAVLGAGSSALLLEMFTVDRLLLVGAGIFLVTAFYLAQVRADETLPTANAPSRSVEAMRLSKILDHPYLRRLVLLIVISTMTVLMTDYLFKSQAAARISHQHLGLFFARFYAALNAIAFVVQVFVSGALVRRFGVVSSLAVMPSLLLLGGAGTVAAGGALAGVLVAKSADGALRHSLHRVTSELLWMPLRDSIRNRAKSVVDSVVGRATQAVTAGVLLLLAAFELDGPVLLGGIIAGLSFVWLFAAFRMRRPYLNLFRDALSLKEDDLIGIGLDLKSVEVIIEALSDRDPDRAIAAVDLLHGKGHGRLIPALILYHESEEVLLRALEVITTPDRTDWEPLAVRLLTHSSEPVRVAAIRALAHAQRRSEDIKERLTDISPAVRAHAAFHLAEQSQKPHPEEDPMIQEILEIEGEKGRAAKLALLDSIRAAGTAAWVDLVLSLAKSDDQEVAEHAVLCIPRFRDPRMIGVLIERLGARNGRAAAREALVALGDEAFEALKEAFHDPKTITRVRLHIPRTISRFMTQAAVDCLTEELENQSLDGRVRFKVLKGLERMVTEGKGLIVREAPIQSALRNNLLKYFRLLPIDLALKAGQEALAEPAQPSAKLVIDLVQDKLRQSEERVFILLRLLHPHEDIRSVQLAQRSADAKTRAQAQEFLDTITVKTSTGLGLENRRLLLLIADDLSNEERVRRAADLAKARQLDYESAILELLSEDDRTMEAVAAHHALKIGSPRLEDAVKNGDGRAPVPSLSSSVQELTDVQ